MAVLANPSLNVDRVLITPECKRILRDMIRWRNGGDFLPTYDDDEAEGSDFVFHTGDEQRRAVILAGHTGIGKSAWLQYALTERLLARQTTLLQGGQNWLYVFTRPGLHTPSAWSLVDSNEELPSVPEFHKSCPHLVIQAATPRAERVKWRHHLNAVQTLYFMKPMALPEPVAGRLLLRTVLPATHVETFFRKFGPSTRGAYAGQLAEWERRAEDAVHRLSYHGHDDALPELLQQAQALDAARVLFLIQPGVNRATWTASIASPHIVDKMRRRCGVRWSEMAARFRDSRAAAALPRISALVQGPVVIA
ncbi:hypothetical protein B0H10DRAFT_2427146 [Mycena sp. CBHHK59/15]|nr:hypothetical protein B0H10DRAFT_2427146 [Mycena sp. CBHHK59/15]